MAISQSTTNEPSSKRTPSSSNPPPLPPFDEAIEGDGSRSSDGDAGGYLSGPACDAIETERARLMTADSVLACLEIAMDREAITTQPPPHFPDVVQVARKLINQSIRHLDCREIGPLIDRAQERARRS